MADEQIHTVTEVCTMIQGRLAESPELRSVSIVGEIFRVSPSHGHYYFELKDAKSRISCSLFANRAKAAKSLPAEGKTMVVTGYIDFYPPYGKLSCIVQDVQEQGEGALYAKFMQLKSKLEAEGLFDPARKRPVTPHPRKIAVVTSPDGAALQDIINQTLNRNPFVELVVIPTKVQGVYAKDSIVAGLRKAQAVPGVDTIILARGGGSIEELWPFNEEAIARAVVASTVPVICGVGHEIDHTIAEFVADVAATTPTQAAVLATRNMHEELDRLRMLFARSRSAAQRRLHANKSELGRMAIALEQLNPRRQLDRNRQACALGGARLDNAYRRQVEYKRSGLTGLGGALSSLDPLSVIARGFSIVTKDGMVVRSIRDVAIGESVSIKVKDGMLQATVDKKEE